MTLCSSWYFSCPLQTGVFWLMRLRAVHTETHHHSATLGLGLSRKHDDMTQNFSFYCINFLHMETKETVLQLDRKIFPYIIYVLPREASSIKFRKRSLLFSIVKVKFLSVSVSLGRWWAVLPVAHCKRHVLYQLRVFGYDFAVYVVTKFICILLGLSWDEVEWVQNS